MHPELHPLFVEGLRQLRDLGERALGKIVRIYQAENLDALLSPLYSRQLDGGARTPEDAVRESAGSSLTARKRTVAWREDYEPWAPGPSGRVLFDIPGVEHEAASGVGQYLAHCVALVHGVEG
jgi:hypothetical protein